MLFIFVLFGMWKKFEFFIDFEYIGDINIENKI